MEHLTHYDQIITLEEQRARAIIERDFDAFERLSHPELRYIHSSGVIDTRDSYLESCRAGRYLYHDIRLPIDEVIVTGHTALILGRFQASLTVDGTDKTLDYPSISVWIWEGNQWLFLAFSPRATDQS